MNGSRSKLFRLTWRSQSFSTTEPAQVNRASSSDADTHTEPPVQPNEPTNSILGFSTEFTLSAISRWGARNTSTPHPREHSIRQSSAFIPSCDAPFPVPPLLHSRLKLAWNGFRLFSAPDEIHFASLARPQPTHLRQSSVSSLKVFSAPTPVGYQYQPSSKLSRSKPLLCDVEALSPTAPPSLRPAALNIDANSDAAASSLVPLGATFEQKAGVAFTTIPSTTSDADQESKDRWTVRNLVNERRVCKLYPARSPRSIIKSRKNKSFRTDGRRKLRSPTPTRAVIAGNLNARYMAQTLGYRSLRNQKRLSPTPISESGTLKPRQPDHTNLWRLVTAREILQADLENQIFRQGPGCRAAIKKDHLPIVDNLGNITETRLKAVDLDVILGDQLLYTRLKNMPLKPSTLKDVWNSDKEDGYSETICLDRERKTSGELRKL
jgi:hypothetical protein